ncbi:toxin co-regulated pilus biosynthesis Q family protein [Marinobacter shengliensis]|uniref:toxin co-regulated pilus biosynthesis Q family protein n=1 Tax=Marinobacter shengliensis TaxID=1389223 RepID=UPI001109B1D9|nr:toxin co-regulated pilus biosynthesis Q family protein [Marinobacter shengliensis]
MNSTLRCFSLCAVALCSSVQAGVYIAPTDDDGSIEYSEEPMYIEVDSKRVKSFLPKTSGEAERSDPNIPMVGSDRLNIEGSGSSDNEMSRGAGVPMRQAIQAVLPDDDWVVNFDGSVSPREPAVWATRGGWDDILRDISERNGVSIAVNEEDKVVGVSDDPGYARLLSAPRADIAGIREARNAGVPAAQSGSSQLSEGDKIWYVSQDLTVRENLSNWAQRADWYIDWDYPTDYEMAAPAQFVGTFKEAARELMYALSDAGYPIGAEVNSKNRVLRIRGVK